MRHTSIIQLLMSPALLVMGAACTTAMQQPGELSSRPPTLVFENVMIDPVTVYLEHAGGRRILGHVEPRRRVELRIPDFGSLRNATDLRIIVVPLGTARNRDGTPDLTGAIVSELEPAETLIGMLWSLNGRTLVSVAFPRGGRTREPDRLDRR